MLSKIDKKTHAIRLQECKKEKDDLLNIKFMDYKPVVATHHVDKAEQLTKGSVILLQNHLTYLPLEEKTTNNVEFIGINIVGNQGDVFEKPFQLSTSANRSVSNQANDAAATL